MFAFASTSLTAYILTPKTPLFFPISPSVDFKELKAPFQPVMLSLLLETSRLVLIPTIIFSLQEPVEHAEHILLVLNVHPESLWLFYTH